MELTDTQKLIRDTVRSFAENELALEAPKMDEANEFNMEAFKKLTELGLTGIPFSEEYGGAGAGYLSYIIALEELAKVCASTALTLSVHISLGTFPIYSFGTDQQKKKYVLSLTKGEKIGALGLTEPNAGSDASHTETTATCTNGGYILNGTKMFVTNGGFADTIVVTAMTDKSKGVHGISAFILEKGWKGIIISKKEDKLGLRGSDTRLITLEEVFVPEENRLGSEGDGFKYFMKTLDNGRIGVAALALGIAEGAFNKAVKYAKERRQFGQLIGTFQAIQFMLADMATEIEAAQHLTYNAAIMCDEGKQYSKESAMAKLFTSEMAMRATKNAIQILGGYGYVKEYEVERYYRDAKLCEIGEGTSEIQRLVIARHVLGKL